MVVLDENQKLEAKEILAKLSELYKARVDLESIKEDRIEKLQYEVAGCLDIVDKKTDVDKKIIKKAMLVSVLNSVANQEQTKYEIDYNFSSMIEDTIKNKKVSNSLLKSFYEVEQELKNNKDDFKEVFKESTLLSKECLEAIAIIAKERYNEYKIDEKLKNNETIKEPKDKSEINEYIELIHKI